MEKKKYLILGHGLTAEYLTRHIVSMEPESRVISTSRNGSPHILFDLLQPKTWSNLPDADFLIWTFPPAPYDEVKLFFEFIKGKFQKLIIVGSTSALKVSSQGETVNEKSALNLELERVKSEVFLKDQGGVLVLSSGIYGPERNPLNWIRSGQVGKNGRWVNMVHLVDLAQFLFQSCLLGKKGQLYIASNNLPQTWNEVIECWEKKG